MRIFLFLPITLSQFSLSRFFMNFFLRSISFLLGFILSYGLLEYVNIFCDLSCGKFMQKIETIPVFNLNELCQLPEEMLPHVNCIKFTLIMHIFIQIRIVVALF